MKAKLSATEFWTLVGLATMASGLTEQLTTVTLAIAKISGEELDECDYGHASDLAYTLDMKAVVAVRGMLSNLGVDHDEQLPAGDSGP